MARAGNRDAREHGAASVEHRQRAVRERCREHPAKTLLHVVRACGDRRLPKQAPGERERAQRSRIAARHVGDSGPERHVLGGEVGRKRRTSDSELEPTAAGDPELPVGSEADIVRTEARRQVRHMPQRRGFDDCDVLGVGAEADHEAASRTVDRDVTGPAGQSRLPHDLASHDVDRDDAAATGVGDERVSPVRVRSCITRLDELVQDVLDPRRADDRDRADRRVADDGTSPDELDRTRVGQRGDRANDGERPQVDNGEPCICIARDERRRRRCGGECGPRAERCGRGQRNELAALHARGTSRPGAEVRHGDVRESPESNKENEVLKDFRQFILRGSLVDFAVAVVIGTAFTGVIAALVTDIITPLIAAIGGQPDFGALTFTINGSRFLYGAFLNALIAFLIVAAVLFFLVIRPVNDLMARRRTEPDVEATTHDCPECLSQIPIGARRCAFCTAVVAPA